MKTRVLQYSSRWLRFWGLREFKRRYPNATVISKWHMTYGDDFHATLHKKYFAEISY